MPIDTATQGTSRYAKTEAAIVDRLLSSQFPKKSYPCVDGQQYKSVVDYATLVEPSDLLIRETAHTFASDRANAQVSAHRSVSVDHSILVSVYFPCAVDSSYFEQASAADIVIPAEYTPDGITIQSQTILSLQDLRAFHPPRNNPESGTRLELTYRATTARN